VKSAVFLVNFGGPRTLGEVPLFLRNITGREPPEAAQEALIARYRAIGGSSPLASITEKQAALLSDATGHLFSIRAAFRYSSPTLEEAINECYRSGTERIVFFVMSPYSTSRTVGGYMSAVEAYLPYLSPVSYHPETIFIHGWCGEPLFVECWVKRIREEAGDGGDFFLFSAHSLPRSLKDEPYFAQVEETVRAVAAGLRLSDYAIGWQSIPQHTDEPWMGPSVEAVMDGVGKRGARLVEIPIGFVSDHLETLYDIDVLHREYALAKGLLFSRIPSLNTYPPFITALRTILEKRLQEGQ
jgi:ferrochelatase